jgi:hypothetical protein
VKAAFIPTEGIAAPMSSDGMTVSPSFRLRGLKVSRRASRLRALLVEALVYLRYLPDPAPPLAVFEREDLVVRPVKVKSYVRYLLLKPL